MFGNVQGWIASLLIFALTGGLVYWKGTPEGISKPTKKLPLGMVSVALKVDPKTVVPPGTKDEDAADYLRQAADAVKRKSRQFEAFQSATGSTKRSKASEIEPELDLLVKAGECAKMNLFAKNPSEVVNYDNSKPILPQLQQLAGSAVAVGAMYCTPDSKTKAPPKDPAKGRRYIESVFHLGRFLYEERQVFEEFRVGVDMMANSAGMLARFGGVDDAKKAQLEAFIPETNVGTSYTDLWQALSGIPEEGKRMNYPGDMFDLAQNSVEPMWRTEATLKLGRMRWMVGVKYGDQKGAERILGQMAAQSDLPPNVKAAAVAARDLKVEKFRMIGGSS